MFTACTKAPDGAPRAGGADRISGLWAAVTTSYCEESQNLGRLAERPRDGEANSLELAATGQAEIAYTAGGPSMPGFKPSVDRPLVAVPIALNATVLAAAGGTRVTDDLSWPAGLRRPYSNIALTTNEVATLIGPGWSAFPATSTAPRLKAAANGYGAEAVKVGAAVLSSSTQRVTET